MTFLSTNRKLKLNLQHIDHKDVMPMISRMTEAEEKLADIIWSNEPIASKDLISICSQKLDWKKSTTYTLLKRLEDKKIFKNEKSVITSLVTKNEYGLSPWPRLLRPGRTPFLKSSQHFSFLSY